MRAFTLLLFLGACRACGQESEETGDTTDTEDTGCEYSQEQVEAFVRSRCETMVSCDYTQDVETCVASDLDYFQTCTLMPCVIRDCLADGGFPTCEDTGTLPTPESCLQDWFDCPDAPKPTLP